MHACASVLPRREGTNLPSRLGLACASHGAAGEELLALTPLLTASLEGGCGQPLPTPAHACPRRGKALPAGSLQAPEAALCVTAPAVSHCPRVGIWETAEDSPSSLKIKCSSSFTVEPGNMGRPVTIS